MGWGAKGHIKCSVVGKETCRVAVEPRAVLESTVEVRGQDPVPSCPKKCSPGYMGDVLCMFPAALSPGVKEVEGPQPVPLSLTNASSMFAVTVVIKT